MQNYRLNPDNDGIREQEKRLLALDIAARTYPGLGRHDGILVYARELLQFVDAGSPTVRRSNDAVEPPPLDELLKLVPPVLLRTKKELEKAGVDLDAVINLRRAPAAADDAGSVGGEPVRDTSADVGTVQDATGGRGPASLRQAGGAD